MAPYGQAGQLDQRTLTYDDMAGAAIYLASRAGDYVVGATIAVDGGIVYANPGIKGQGWD